MYGVVADTDKLNAFINQCLGVRGHLLCEDDGRVCRKVGVGTGRPKEWRKELEESVMEGTALGRSAKRRKWGESTRTFLLVCAQRISYVLLFRPSSLDVMYLVAFH